MKVFTSLTDPELIRLILAGGVGVLPTDTVYGVVALARGPAAVQRLYDSKNRKNKPGTVIAASTQQLMELGVAPQYLRQVEHLWPNPLSIKLPIGPKLEYLQPGSADGAFRVVAEPAVLTLLEQTGPLLTSSANRPGEAPATDLHEAQAYFGERIDFYVDGGSLRGRPPSTIIRLAADGQFELVRAGAVII